jgi:hypothetical protein
MSPSKLRSLEALASRRPALFPFGTDLRMRLGREEEVTATVEDRLRAIWAFLLDQATLFQRRLKLHELSGFDLEDCLQEIAAELIEKDHSWEPARGRYITFAGTLADRVLRRHRDNCRLVSVRNAACRLARYRQAASEDRLSNSAQVTAARLAAVFEAPTAVEEIPSDGDPTELEIERRDREATAQQEVIRVLRRARGPAHAMILSRLYGLSNTGTAQDAPQRAEDVGASLGISTRAVRRREEVAIAHVRSAFAREQGAVLDPADSAGVVRGPGQPGVVADRHGQVPEPGESTAMAGANDALAARVAAAGERRRQANSAGAEAGGRPRLAQCGSESDDRPRNGRGRAVRNGSRNRRRGVAQA